jgi:hypothetical protein
MPLLSDLRLSACVAVVVVNVVRISVETLPPVTDEHNIHFCKSVKYSISSGYSCRISKFGVKFFGI